MDTSFVFPRPQAPIPRPSLAHNKLNSSGSGSSTATTAADTTSRESSALRASVLDAALELGLGSNSMVANWMFSNTLEEEPEEAEDPVSSPGLTYGSSATSDESSFSALTTPSSSTHSSSATASSSKFQQPLHSMNTRPGGANGFLMGIEEEESKAITFPETLVPQRPTTPAAATTTTRKLKKKHKGDGGYESDGGYLSEGGKKKDKKEKGVAFPSVETEKEAKKRAKQEKKELLEEERQRKKSLTKASKKAAAADSKDYDTDGGGMSFGLGKSKSKKKSSSSSKGASEDMGYETDGGAKKSKTRFFKLSNKGSTRPDLSGVLKGSSNGGSAEVVPAVPAIPKEVVSLPIAERFATTLMSSLSQESSHLLSPTPTESSSSSFGDRSTAATPLPSGFQSFSPIPASANTPNTTYPNYNTPYPTPRSREPIPFPTSAHDRVSSASQGTTTTTSSGSGSSHGRSAAAALEYTYKHHGNTNGSGSGSQSTLHSPQVEQRPFSPPMPMSPPPSGSLKPPPSQNMNMSMPNSRSVSPAMTSSVRSRSPMPSSPLPSLFPSSSMPPSPNTATQSNSNSNTSSSPITTTSPTTITTPTSTTTTPPVVPLNVKKGGGMRLKPSLENIGRSLRSHLPGGSSSNAVSPISPVSPYSATGGGMQNPARALSPTQQKQKQIYFSPPNTAVPPLDAHAQEDEEESSRLTIVPPSPGPSSYNHQNYIVPSPSPRMSGLPRSPSPNPNARYSQAHGNNGGNGQRLSGLPPSPNVLAYYDIPPPSPPPVGPLPSVPLPVPQAGGFSASAPVSPRLSPMLTTSSPSPSFQNNNTNKDVTSFLTNPHQFPSAEVLRQRVIDRTPRAPVVVPAEFVSIQRGKESPFPKRPVLGVKPVPRRYEGLSYGQEGVGAGRHRDGVNDDAEEWERARGKEMVRDAVKKAKEKVEKNTRFREVPSWIPGRAGSEREVSYVSSSSEEDREDGYGGMQDEDLDQEEEEDGKDILDALDGFVDRREESFETRERDRGGRALGRSRSFEALRSGGDDDGGGSPGVVFEHTEDMEERLPPARPRIKSPPLPPPSDPASTLLSTSISTPNHRSSAYTYASEYTYEGDDHTTIGNRSSRWSAGSVYSRASILDEDESGRTRERLLREVEALMAKQRGRGARQEGEGEVIPPVPRLPDAYAGVGNVSMNVNGGGSGAGVGRGWNRF